MKTLFGHERVAITPTSRQTASGISGAVQSLLPFCGAIKD